MKILVCIPTYNEKENIANLVPRVIALDSSIEVLVIDDSSPDGTADVVLKMADNEKRVHLLSRAKKQGLGKAYLAGFRWGLDNGYDAIFEMDADFSHRPEDLAKLVLAIQKNDFVIGSRYVSGGGTVNWGLLRKFISVGGGVYSRLILGFPIQDWTGGFNGWTRKVLETMGLDQVKSNGYSFQIELKYRASKLGFKGQEVPIIFEDRRVGQSKMSFKIVIEALYKVWWIKFLL